MKTDPRLRRVRRREKQRTQFLNDIPQELAVGWNMTTAFDGALGERSTAIAALIAKLQSGLNNE